MALNEDQPRLGCGRIIDDVWASIDQPPTAHEQTCPDCQSARLALHHLETVTESLRERDRDDPALQPGIRVKEAIMMVARAEVRRSRRTPLATTALGVIDISEQALSGLIRFAASTLPGVRARRCTITSTQTAPQSAAEPAAAVDAENVRITLTVAISSGVRIPATMDLLRERVNAVVQAQTSITMQQIDIIVEDLYDL
ncbi:Asp23/Gls24 family envelope stress response protein [Arthrobacter agilis]|uniref:Asp23/Gls24 family envelope stress response protein n=1 Tax=Arthrobacter agilis TaxID=37921 RepID=UPI00277DED07|nr:Asp23/Gls24 family envelope stress response protein [Arthrobacter agilis]MDQ0734860.1 putative alkaline shock family protein YloU [Arthrobacter agilis]